MRNAFLIILISGLMIGLPSCQKEDSEVLSPCVPVSLTASIPPEVLLRSVSDYGQALHINRCILEIYHDGALYGARAVQAVTAGQVVFPELMLVSSQTYDFVLWADCADGLEDKYYDTTDFSEIAFKMPYAGNDDGFDAFFAKVSYTVSGSLSESITLTRPFAQLCVMASDIDAATPDASKPTHVTVEFAAIPTTFNLLTGEPGTPKPVSYTAGVENVNAGEMTVDYIWAEPEQDDLVQFSITTFRNGTMLTSGVNFDNVPIHRNYRTNVSRKLMP